MKHIFRALTAVILALLMAGLMPAQVFADTPDYISEIKVYQGSYDKAAEEGFTILNGDDGKPVDLNQGSGSTDTGAKGNKKVFLGYKTTKKRSEAITDLALMNMKGGYDVAEYEKLMAGQMSEQIMPFVESFIAAITEYRINYNSRMKENRQRAQFIHDILNKLTDDDCGGAGLGDLLLNKTKYEMNDATYEALSESDKKKHADILTIVAQSNGKLMLVLENLITRGADTNDDTWFERFENTTYDDLLELQGGSPTDAVKALAKKYDDDAQIILGKWDAFREELLSYEKNVEAIDAYDEEKAEEAEKAIEGLDKNADDTEVAKAVVTTVGQQIDNTNFINSAQNACLYDILSEIDYLDGTMLDFFSLTSEEIEDDITLLYPLVASLTEGQRAGIDFLSLSDFFAVALTTAEGYQSIDLSKLDSVSIYQDVDRGIYQKGGVALTSDALRADALTKMVERNNSVFSTSSIAMMVITGVCAVGAFASFATWATIKMDIASLNKIGDILNEYVKNPNIDLHNVDVLIKSHPEVETIIDNAPKNLSREDVIGRIDDYIDDYYDDWAPRGSFAGKLAIGLTVATIIIGAITAYLSYRDMKAHYKVDFTPIPHYMVDKEDLIGYNSKGEEIVLKNQSAYYKAVESNRKKGDDYFNDIDTCADMNGCVNPQWLALYAAKNESMNPILASSLKVVVGNTTVPEGYNTGIHMFGEKAAFNLNNKLYCWNQKAKSIMVYYKTDNSASAAASNFTSGTLALAGGGGVLLGACITALGMKATGKRKENKTVTA